MWHSAWKTEQDLWPSPANGGNLPENYKRQSRTMTSRLAAGLALIALAGCASSVPDSNPRGVGFGDYDKYEAERAQREAALSAPIGSTSSEGMAIAQDTMSVLGQPAPGQAPAAAPVPVATAALPATPGNPAISDEQNFDAVASRETIESDRERLARQRDSFQIAQPEALPERPSGNAAPNIVNYALATTNPVGQPVYSRSTSFNEDRYRRACAEFTSSDQAQAAFLASGGPDRDRRGLDPDGDGFACFWDPRPFRMARGG